jgi:caffeoyl-CoA O-methyltransferase
LEDPVDILSPALSDYLLAHSTQPDALLRDLAEETRRTFPDSSGMQISHDEGEFLTMLVRITGARRAVEVGVFTGYSSLCIARGLPADGTLLACDVSEEWTSVAQRYWSLAGVADKIDLRIAPALDTLRALPAEESIDIAFIDADKVSYPAYYEEIITRLRPGGLVLLDNVLRGGRVLDPDPADEATTAIMATNDLVVADPRVDVVMLPLRDGVTIARKR